MIHLTSLLSNSDTRSYPTVGNLSLLYNQLRFIRRGSIDRLELFCIRNIASINTNTNGNLFQ
jgi:hypothetical protein